MIRTTFKICRLPHICQWKKAFNLSNSLFDEVIHECTENSQAKSYLDFAYQHSGKNYFDQQQYTKALEHFNMALKIRIEKGSSKDQIDSTELAIRRTKELLEISGDQLA